MSSTQISHLKPRKQILGIDKGYYWSGISEQITDRKGGLGSSKVFYMTVQNTAAHSSGTTGGDAVLAESDDRYRTSGTVYTNPALIHMMKRQKAEFPNMEMCYIDASHRTYEELEALIEKEKPDIVAFSGFTVSAPWIYAIGAKVKAFNPKAKIIAGNDHFHFMCDEILRGRQGREIFDYIGLGNNGEFTMAALLHHLDGNLPIQKVPSIAYVKNKRVVKQTTRDIPLDYRELTDYDLIAEEMKRYNKLFKLFYGGFYHPDRQKMIVAQFDSGCSWGEPPEKRCKHCSIPELTVEARNVDKDLIDYIEKWVSEGFNIYLAGDSTLGMDGFVTDLSAACESSDILRGKRWGLAYGQIGEFMRNAEKATWLQTWNFGLETFDRRLLAKDCKGIVARYDQIEALELAQELGINVYASGILGLPGSTKETLKTDVDKWLELAERFPNTLCNITVSLPIMVPGSKMFLELLKSDENGIIKSPWFCEDLPLYDLSKEYIETNCAKDHDGSPQVTIEYALSELNRLKEGIRRINEERPSNKRIHVGSSGFGGSDPADQHVQQIRTKNFKDMMAVKASQASRVLV